MSSVSITEALARPAAERGAALLALAEDQWFDRKSGRVSARDLANDLIAFANADGGTLVVGLHAGRVEGIDGAGATKRNALQQAAVDFSVPPVRAASRLVACRRADGGDDHLLVFDVEPSAGVHASVRDEVYLRVGDESRRLSYGQRRELEFDKGQASYEATALTDAGWDEIDDGLLGAYAEEVKARDGRTLLQARGLVTQRGALTVGAILLFGRSPQARFPQAFVRVARYRGSERGTGARRSWSPTHAARDRWRSSSARRRSSRSSTFRPGRRLARTAASARSGWCRATHGWRAS